MTVPNHSHRPAHTMDARHPRALFPALAAPDSRPTIGVLALQGDVRELAAGWSGEPLDLTDPVDAELLAELTARRPPTSRTDRQGPR